MTKFGQNLQGDAPVCSRGSLSFFVLYVASLETLRTIGIIVVFFADTTVLIFVFEASPFHAFITHLDQRAFAIRILKLHFVSITSFARDGVNQSAILFFIRTKNAHAEYFTHPINPSFAQQSLHDET